MFFASSFKSIDPHLQKLGDEIEGQNPGLSVLAAHQFRYRLRQSLIELTVKQSRHFNVLEEFIIRAGLEIFPSPTEDELASVLGLDPVFVRSTIATLQALQTLTVSSPISVTPEGRLFYEKGLVPQPPYSVKVYIIADPLCEKLTCQAEPLENILVNLPDLADFISIPNTGIDISSLPLEELQEIIQASGLALHVPEEGKIVTSCKAIAPYETIWKTISLFVFFNSLEDKLILQVRSGKKILESASKWLEELQAEGQVSLKKICKLSDEPLQEEATLNQKNLEIEARIEKIRQQAIKTARQKSAEQEKTSISSKVVLLPDREVTQAFKDILSSAQHQVLIYSPCLNQAVVEEQFLQMLEKLAKQGVWILIGYGISPLTPDVEAKLRAIKTPEGLSAVQVFSLGDSHVKEVIVDQKIYLCGSYNWLSYQGDYLPQGELVYRVTSRDQIQEAYGCIANRFKNYAQQLWNDAVQKPDFQLATEALCIWGALDMEDMALTSLQQNNWLELLPVWLNVVLQGLRSKKVPVDAQSLTSALSLLSRFSLEETFIESLREGWSKVISAIAIHNDQAALNLLSKEVWQEFLRLAIAQPHMNTPEEFIAEFATSHKNLPKPPIQKSQTPKSKKTKPRKSGP